MITPRYLPLATLLALPLQAHAALEFGFDDATLQGWTTVSGSASQQVFAAKTHGPLFNSIPGPQAGSHLVGVNFGYDPMPGSPWDAAHATMWIRSPEFALDGSGNLTTWLTGGNASGWNPVAYPMGSVTDVPVDSAVDGFMGIALRRVEDNTFVLVKTMPGDNNAGGWTATTMTQAELAPYANDGKTYTLEFIDSFHGSWPFQAMDSVSIPGSIPGNTPPTITPIADVGSAFDEGPIGPIEFEVGDSESPPGELLVSASSSNPLLVPAVEPNISFGTTGDPALRTVTITPLTDAFGSATITIQVSDGVENASTSFLFTVERPEFALSFDFDDATLQGWTLVAGDPAQQVIAVKTHGPLFNEAPGPEAGSHLLGATFGYDPPVASPWDAPHATMWARSPEFKLDGSGPLAVFLTGGNAASWNPGVHPMDSPADVPADSLADGFMGIALRKVSTGTFVLIKRKPGDNIPFGWTPTIMTRAELAPFVDPEETYTLDYIEARHGGYGFQAMDTVGIPGTLVSPPASAYENWAASQITAIDPGAAAGFDDDPDGDGITNGLEWILGGNPLAQDAASLFSITGSAASGLTLSFDREEDSIGVATLAVEYGSTLAAWPGSVTIGAASSGPDGNGVAVTVNDVPNPDEITVNIPASNAPGGKLFARLKATLP
jgi:hypothetical protein